MTQTKRGKHVVAVDSEGRLVRVRRSSGRAIGRRMSTHRRKTRSRGRDTEEKPDTEKE